MPFDEAYLAERESDLSRFPRLQRAIKEREAEQQAVAQPEPLIGALQETQQRLGALKGPPSAPAQGGRGVLGDIGAGIAESPKAVVGGMRDALQEEANLAADIGNWLAGKVGLEPTGRPTPLPEVGHPESVTGGLIRSAAQFLSAFAPISKGVKAAKVAKAVGQYGQSAVAGFGAMFSAFDPHSPRMSDLFNHLAPGLKNPLTDFLASDPNDSDALGRLKNAIEGELPGAAVGLLLRVASRIKLNMKAGKIEQAHAQAEAFKSSGPEAGAAPAAEVQPAQGLPETRPSPSLKEQWLQRSQPTPIPPAPLYEEWLAKGRPTTLRGPAIQAQEEATRQALSVQRALERETVVPDAVGKILGPEAADIVSDISQHTGLTPRDTQASIWAGKQIVKALGDEAKPITESVTRAADEQGITSLLQARGMSEGGQMETATLFMLGRAAVGAGIGGAVGETPEERLRHAFLGAGLGVGLNPVLIRTVKKLAKDPEVFRYLKDESGAIRMGKRPPFPEPPPVKADELQTLAKDYRAAVEESTRGVRPHEQAHAEADLMRAAGRFSVEDVKAIMPGTAMNDAEAVAVIKTLVGSGERLRVLAAEVKAGAPPDEFLKQIYAHSQIDPKRLGVVAEAGRTLSVMNEPTSGMNQFLNQFKPLLEGGYKGITAQRLAEMITELKDPAQLAVMARQMAKPGWSDMIVEAWINGLLWTAQLPNLAGNTVMIPWAVAQRKMGRLLSGGHGVAPGEAEAMLSAIPESIGEAWTMVKRSFRTEGREGFGGASKIEARPNAISAETLNLTGTVGRAFDYIGVGIRLPGTMLGAADDGFKLLNYRMELRAQARRMAFEQIQGEGLSGTKAVNRLNELERNILADPGDSIKASAERFAAAQVFTESMGEIGQGVMMAARHPVVRAMVPFVRVPINIVKQGFQATPLGLLSSEVRRDLRGLNGAAARDLALGKLSLGTMTMGLISLMAANGMVVGGPPADPKARLMLESEGVKWYSFRFGDKYWPYLNPLGPVGMIVGMAADIYKAVSETEDPLSLDGLQEAGTASVTSMAKMFGQQTFVLGLSRALAAVASPDRSFEQFAEGLAAGTVPGIVGQVARVIDPTVREARSITDAMLAKVPYYSKTLSPRRNAFGEALVRDSFPWSMLPASMQPSTKKDDPVIDALIDDDIVLDKPSRTVPGTKDLQLSDEEYDRYVVLAGNETKIGGLGFKDRLGQMIESGAWDKLSPGPEGARAYQAKTLRDAYRAAAWAQLRKEFPGLGHDADESRRERARKLIAPVLSESLGRVRF